MAEKSDPAAAKRFLRLTEAKLVVGRADRWVQNHPGQQATVLIRDMRLALNNLIEEVGYQGK